MKEQKYVVIKKLPDADVGIEVIWDETNNCYYYEKSAHVSPNDKSYLTAGQVTQTPEFFCKAIEYAEYYGYHFPVLSRKEVLNLLDSHYNKTNTPERRCFETDLRELAKINAEKLIK